jgi:NADH-quinone oxidoreductase subunit I
MLEPPFPMADGLEERDYYQGKVSAPTSAQQAYVEQRDAGHQPAEADSAHSADSADSMKEVTQ